MPFLLTLLKSKALPYILAAVACFSAGWWVNGQRWENLSHERLNEQEALLIGQCNDQKKITEDSSNEYQKALSAANSKLATYRRLYANKTVPIASTANGSDAAPGRNIDTGKNGIAAESLFELAGECENYRNQVIGLQGFINKVWQ